MSYRNLLGCAFVALLAIPAYSQDFIPMWQRSSALVLPEQNPLVSYLTKFETFRVNYDLLAASLKTVKVQQMGRIQTGSVFDMPMPDGRTQKFRIAEAPMMTEELAKQIPSRTYRVEGIDDPYATGRLDIGHNGFHAFIMSPNGHVIVDPISLGNKSEYLVYYRRDNHKPREFNCYTDALDSIERTGNGNIKPFGAEAGGTLKTYRLAMNATSEYTAFFGGVSAAQAAVVTSVNRNNQVYQIDCALTMTLVRNNCYTGNDPFTNDDGFAMLSENQTVCDATPGNAGYDIGHVFSTGGGGVAALQSVGVTGVKAQGVTGSPSPVGDPFDIDYVAHEMGHQYGAPHTFNSTAGACGGGNRSANSAYEPGSGTTIMAYAGICSPENVQNNSDAHFHADSLTRIWNWRNNSGSGGTSASNGNTEPTVNAGADVTIPQGTPYKLTATGSDPNNDPVTYEWEQMDLGSSTSSSSQVSTGPLVRARLATTSPSRFVPALSTVLANGTDNYEKLPNTNRTMTWRAIIRDNRSGGGGYNTDDKVVTVSGSPFQVTAPNTAVSLTGGTSFTVTWNVGGGSSAANVKILLSTNGGASYGTGTATTILASTPNDGSQVITVPNVNSTQCRIIVEAVGNIFYDISDTNFTIASTLALSSVTTEFPSVEGGTSTFGTVTLSTNAPNAVNVTLSDNSAAVTVPASVSVPSGASTANFAITTTSVASTTNATITATFNGTKTTTLQVTPAALPSALTLSPTSIGGGGSVTATVTLDRPATGAGTVLFVTKSGSEVTVPSTVLVPNGSTTADFTVSTSNVSTTVNRTVTVTRNDTSRTATLTITAVQIINCIITPANVVGGNESVETVYLNAPAPAGFVLTVRDNDSRTGVPATVTVPEGATQVTFPITSQGTPVQFTSEIRVSRAGQMFRRFLVVYPPALNTFAIAPTIVKGGETAVGTITMNGKAFAAGVYMSVSSDGPEATVPATVGFPQNVQQKTFNITTIAVSARVIRTITVTYNGVTRTKTLTINK